MTAENISTDRQPEKSGGALEDFIATFNAYEAENGLFADCRDADGFPWWDMARYRVQYAICIERGIYAQAPGQPSPVITRAKSFIRQRETRWRQGEIRGHFHLDPRP